MPTTPNLGLSQPATGDTSWSHSADLAIIDELFDATTGNHDHNGTDGHGKKLSQANTHESPDTDSATSALHHTLGTGANQAAAGNHNHTGTYQPLDSDLTTIAGLTATTDNFIQAKSSAWASRTPAQVTADLPAVVGDSGSGGTKGLVPAPGAGDAAAGKFLKADGTFAVPAGSGMTNPMTTQDDLIVGGAAGAPARLAKGTDGQVLTVDPTTHHLVWATPSGGGGSALTVEEVDGSPTDSAVTKIVFPNGTLGIASHVATYTPAGGGSASISRGADASRPAAGNAGALYLPTDGQVLHEDNGTSWQPWGPLFPFTPPVNGDFSWVNQGGAAVTATNSGIYLASAGTSDGGALNARMRVKSAPTPPYTITAWLLPSVGYGGIFIWGLFFRESSSGKCHAINMYNDSTGVHLDSILFNSATSFGSSYQNANVSLAPNAPICVRIADDNTNRIISFSGDGQHFFSYHSVGRTNTLTADQVGFHVSAYAAIGGVTLLSWKEA